MLMSVTQKTLPTQVNGTLRIEDIEDAIREDDPHFPKTRLVALENTHNKCGGRVLTTKYIDEVGMLCNKHGLILHIDGARIFNAATVLGESVARLTRGADSVSVCMSKGLGTYGTIHLVSLSLCLSLYFPQTNILFDLQVHPLDPLLWEQLNLWRNLGVFEKCLEVACVKLVYSQRLVCLLWTIT